MKEPLWLKIALIVAGILLGLIVWVIPAKAAAIYQSEFDGIRVVLYDDACMLSAVANLPSRAEWTEGGRTFDGCWARGGHIIVAYFSDRTIVLFPVQAFERVTSS